MSTFTPQLGQMLYTTQAWSSFELPEYAQALFFAIKEEIERVYWNREQSEWEGYEDPGIKGITWKSYYWGEDETEASLPNFTFEDVELRFYKYPGRDMSTNVDWTPDRWVKWFGRCMKCVRRTDPPM